MTPVGETLRRERLKRNLELEEISGELKVSKRFLQAIENDEYDKLPGGVFAKSWVLQYARLLGLDEATIGGQVRQVLGLAPEVAPFAGKPKPAGFAAIQETVGDNRFRWSGWLSAAVLVAVMVVCSAVYAWMQRPKTPVTAQANSLAAQSGAEGAIQSAPASAQVAAQPEPRPSVTAPTPSSVDPGVAPAQPVEQKRAEQKRAEQKPVEPRTGAARVKPTHPDATVRIEITAEEAVWMLARADGKYAFSATLDPHTTRTVEGLKEVTLRLGNAGGVTISLNGRPIGPAGPKGQVRTLQFTSGGFQIVPPNPPSAPLDRL